ncbi:MAG: SUMF1/EgtB/PvdO family nonheme iron enzyme [bacterium]
MSREPEWDFFLAHAGEDKAIAEELYEALAAGDRARVFLDSKCLDPGDTWPRRLAEAQRRSRITVVLISGRTADAYYQQEEIAAALSLARKTGDAHRVVPVYLDGEPGVGSSIPYGLRAKHALVWPSMGGARGVADRLLPVLSRERPIHERRETPQDRALVSLANLVEQRILLRTRGQRTTKIDLQIAELKRKRRENRPSLGIGDCLIGSRFELREKVGHGGFGDVWRAMDWDANGKPVAIKVLHGQWLESAERRERFFRGARRMAEIDHPGVVRIVLPKAEDAGFAFYVMEYLADGDFGRAVLGGGVTPERAFDVSRQVAAALHHAHEEGLVHRDVKPENIVLGAGGRAALTDFDLVHALDTTGATRSRAAMGSFYFAAPEAQEDASHVDRRADVYSLGVTTIFALLGRALKHADFRDWGNCINGLLVSNRVRAVLRGAVAYAREDRFDSCAAFADALAKALAAPRESRIEVVSPVAPRAADPFQDALRAAGLEWVEIPAGSFLMGSQDPESFDNERPIHRVQLSAFAMSRYPVTSALYGVYLADSASALSLNRRNARPSADGRHPVVSVSWHDATAFCAWLSARTGESVRLPTEAEWEYACRAGSTGARYGALDAIAWHRGNSSGRVHPVGQKERNAWGLHDMLGNVWEWGSDWDGTYPAAEAIDPQGPRKGSYRVLRGGGWNASARLVRAAYRYWYPPDARLSYFGFRIARGQGALTPEPGRRDLR